MSHIHGNVWKASERVEIDEMKKRKGLFFPGCMDVVVSSRMDPVLWIVFFICLLPQVVCIKWLAINSRQGAWNRSSECIRTPYLSRGQRSICRSHVELMAAVVHASTRTIGVCQDLFAGRRWNCSSVTQAPNFLPDLTGGSREQAFVYALSSASIVHSISRACSAGITTRCSCGDGSSPERRLRTSESGDFRWEGCSDNLDYGLNFSQMFTDAYPTTLNSRRVKVNGHNYAAGRKATMSSITDACKCHGVSGSCSMRTCWRTLGDLRSTGSTVQRLYDSAVQVVYRRPLPGSSGSSGSSGSASGGGERRLEPSVISNRVSLSPGELIFYNQSPDFCLPEKELGSVGTKDRICEKNQTGSFGCRSMCCGRGHWTNSTQVQYRCECKYYWCCYVKCNICVKTIEIHGCL